MKWPWSKSRRPSEAPDARRDQPPMVTEEFVDLDRDVIPLHDDLDVTSLFLTLTMERGGGTMNQRRDGTWEVMALDNRRTYLGTTQREAIEKALADT